MSETDTLLDAAGYLTPAGQSAVAVLLERIAPRPEPGTRAPAQKAGLLWRVSVSKG